VNDTYIYLKYGLAKLISPDGILFQHKNVHR